MILGSGGREHAMAWKIAESSSCNKLFIVPGNAGTEEIGIDELLVDLRGQAYELGGEFNGPGIWHDIKKLIREKI